jgi:hypothetical protein
MIHDRISIWRPLWPASGDSKKRGPKLRAGLDMNPTFTVARVRGAPTDSPTVRAGWERVIDGLRKAGVPEG